MVVTKALYIVDTKYKLLDMLSTFQNRNLCFRMQTYYVVIL